MSFKVIAALYGTLATTTAVGLGTAYMHGGAGSGHGRNDGAETAAVASHAGAYVDDRRFGLVLPYDPALHGAQGGGRNGSRTVVTWYRTREEVALAAEHAAQVTGDPQIIRTAQIQRALASNDAKSALASNDAKSTPAAEAPARPEPAEAHPQAAAESHAPAQGDAAEPHPQPALASHPAAAHAASDDRHYALVLPYDARIHGASGGGRNHEKETISWYRSREEMARAAEDAARLSGNPQILRIAREKRALADREAADRHTVDRHAVADSRPSSGEPSQHQ